MALTRRVVTTTSVPQQKGSPESELATEPTALELAATGTGRASLLDHVPTQRGALPEAPEPLQTEEAPARRRGRVPMVAVAVTVSAALVVGTAVVAHARSTQAAERAAANVRVAAALAAQDTTDMAARYTAERTASGAWVAALATAREKTRQAATDGAQQLAADLNADPALLAALQAAVDLANATAADGTASLIDLSAAAAGIAAPAKAASDSQAAWQAAEQARIAAEQQAAADAAAKAAADAGAAQAAAAAAAKPVAPAPKPAVKPATSSGTQTSPAPTGGTVQPIPAGGLVCPGAPVGAGVGETSYSAIGSAINAWRAGQGLPALAITRSATLVAHAEDMAASGGIWHSGFDNIVGCTSGNIASLINAWANSAPHRAQMLRTDVTTMKIGGATSGGWLYGAVKFS